VTVSLISSVVPLTNVKEAAMANPDHLNTLEQGVDAWNAWRKQQSDTIPDLNGAELSGANLAGANLKGTDLKRGESRRGEPPRGEPRQDKPQWGGHCWGIFVRCKLS
jgi:uncharacterized protein YjbI with pentapeptide repeats